MVSVDFSELIGKTLVEADIKKDSDGARFVCSDGSVYHQFHQQDCCEGVWIEEVFGDVEDIIGSEIIDAREETSGENPADVGVDTRFQDSFTWTFYILRTAKGDVTIRWYGESNGYYSESVSFFRER